MKIKSSLKILMLGLGIGLLIYVTWQIGQVYLSLIEKEKKNYTVDEELLVLPQLEFWTCQIGVFENEENSLKEQARLKTLGFEAEIFSYRPWRVGIGLATSEKDLLALRENLNNAGINHVIKKVTIPEKRFKILGNNAKIMSETLKFVNNFISGTYSVDELYTYPQVSDVFYDLIYMYNKSGDIIESQTTMLKIYSEYYKLINQLTKIKDI